jgi:hypothetical protein
MPLCFDHSPRLEAWVREFEQTGLAELEAELEFHRVLPDTAAAVSAVATWRGKGGKVHGRQRRMPRVVKEAAGKALLRAHFARARTFEALLRQVRQAIGSVCGVGEVTVYDVALRIGIQRDLLPERVRLHATARESAVLLGLEVSRRSWISCESFPRPLRRLAPWGIERFLSTYREELEQLSEPQRRASFSVALAPYLLARTSRLAA